MAMSSTTKMFLSASDPDENENNTNGERSPPPSAAASGKEDINIRRKACTDQFLRMEDTLNGLFEDIVKRKTRLHEDVENVQEILKAYMDSIDNIKKVEEQLQDQVKCQTAKLQWVETENSDLHRKVENLADEFGESQSKLKQAETENSELKIKVEKLADEFGRSQSKLQRAETENSDLQRKVENLADVFGKSQSNFKQAEMETSAQKRKVEKLTGELEKSKAEIEQSEVKKSDWEKKIEPIINKSKELEAELKETKTENSNLKKELTKFKESEEHFTKILKQYREENGSLKLESKNYDVQIFELEQNLKESKQENEKMLLRLKESDESSCENVGAEKNVQTATTQQNSKNSKEDEKNGDDDCANLHQDIIDLMADLFQKSYTDIFTMAIQNNLMDKSKVEDILFHTLWGIYSNSRNVVMMQLNKLRKSLYNAYTAESEISDLTVPKDINNDLKRLMAKVEVQDAQRRFKEDLLSNIHKKYPRFPIYDPKFISYITDCFHFCRQLLLKSECLHLKSAKLDASVDRNEFNLTTGKVEDNVKRVIIPALVCWKNNVPLTLRKGDVSSLV